MEIRTDEKLMFSNDELAKNVWKSKYAADGETHYDQMHRRMAKEFARVEEKYQQKEHKIEVPFLQKTLSKYGLERANLSKDSIYKLFKDFKYIVPQGSVMYGLGRKDKYISLSNCFFIGRPMDSYSGIFQKDQESVQLYKRRGGVGLDISDLRPSGTIVSNSADTSTGAISFMERFSNSARETGQNGRRAALMIIIDINHPDVKQFATIKSDLSKVTGANISIKLNREFMEAVENDKDYVLRFPCNKKLPNLPIEDIYPNELKTFNDRGERYYIKKIKAKEYWNTIVKQARNNAEPGLLFWDNVLDYGPDSVYDEYRPMGTNPCGEVTLPPYDSCRLMCLNLYSFVDNPFTDKAKINYKRLYEVAYEQQRLMDDLVDLETEAVDKIIKKIENDPEPLEVKQTELNLWKKIRETGINGRRTGSGITALADMLAAMGVKYDSQEALDIIDKVMKTKMEGELDCTIDLSILRGSFKGWDKELEFPTNHEDITIGANKFYKFIQSEFPSQYLRMYEYGRRNISWSTLAPTGSVSILTQTTSGIEPLFQPFYTRRKKINPSEGGVRVDFVDETGDSWQEFPILHAKFRDWCINKIENSEVSTIGTSEEALEHYLKDPKKVQLMFEKSPWYKATANDINWIKRVEVQSIIQKYISHSISSTINLPEDVTEEEVSNIYKEAYLQGLKGVTVYREGSRSGVLVAGKEDKKEIFPQYDAPKRPKKLKADLHMSRNSGNTFAIIVGLLDDKPYETFIFNTLGEMYKPESGTIIKIKKGHYRFESDSTIIDNISDSGNTELEKAFAVYTSMLLRGGAKIEYVIKVSKSKINDNISSFVSALCRVLNKYDKSVTELVCDNCGGKVIKEGGCQICLDCGEDYCG